MCIYIRKHPSNSLAIDEIILKFIKKKKEYYFVKILNSISLSKFLIKSICMYVCMYVSIYPFIPSIYIYIASPLLSFSLLFSHSHAFALYFTYSLSLSLLRIISGFLLLSLSLYTDNCVINEFLINRT